MVGGTRPGGGAGARLIIAEGPVVPRARDAARSLPGSLLRNACSFATIGALERAEPSLQATPNGRLHARQPHPARPRGADPRAQLRRAARVPARPAGARPRRAARR